jgi:hypothetical protein
MPAGDHAGDFHAQLVDDAERLWVEWMARCEDRGESPSYAIDVATVACAMMFASVVGAVADELGEKVPDAELVDRVVDFELTLLKEVARKFPKVLEEVTGRRMAALDRRVKRARAIDTKPGGEA